MPRRSSAPLTTAILLLPLLLLAQAYASAARAQCVDSSEVNGFRVRAVKFRSLFGRTPKRLRQTLDAHRGEPYSAARAKQYIDEIVAYRSNDPAQQKYERLIANKLKLSVKGGLTELECVERVEPAQCQKAFPGSAECVDVTIRRYFVEIDALNSSPFLLLFPRSALAALYDAIPRPLLALNPGLDAAQDRRFGPAAGVDTATDLLDLRDIFGRDESAAATTAPAPQPPASPAPTPGATPDELDVVITSGGSSAADSSSGEDPPVDLGQRDTKLLLGLKARKSLSKDFYDTSTSLKLERSTPLKFVQRLSLDTRFDARHLPQGEGDFLTNAGALGFSADLRPKGGVVNLINVGGRYRWSRNRLAGTGVAGETATENGFEARVIADGDIRQGLVRAALWLDGGGRDGGRGSYRRFAGLVGYGKEFALPRKREFRKIRPPELGGRECWTSYAEDPEKNPQTIGVELIAGAGLARGDVPEYSRFYAGSPPGQFLYDELNAQSLTAFPAGPLIRSLGQRQAGVVAGAAARGGTSYWHANLNVSLPVAAWSRPLIPHEWVTASALRDEDVEFKGHIPDGASVCRDLKSTVKTLVRVSGVNLLINQQGRDALTDDQRRDLRLRNKPDPTPEEQARLAQAEAALAAAKARAKPQVEDLFRREILPITDFVADHANIISVKPLLMFDVARLRLGRVDDRTRYAAGGGLQLDVVLARFEFGYLAALNRAPGDPRGHAVGRLILRRFF
jgi:hypothetical protein